VWDSAAGGVGSADMDGVTALSADGCVDDMAFPLSGTSSDLFKGGVTGPPGITLKYTLLITNYASQKFKNS
jgi:hypothetical protein